MDKSPPCPPPRWWISTNALSCARRNKPASSSPVHLRCDIRLSTVDASRMHTEQVVEQLAQGKRNHKGHAHHTPHEGPCVIADGQPETLTHSLREANRVGVKIDCVKLTTFRCSLAPTWGMISPNKRTTATVGVSHTFPTDGGVWCRKRVQRSRPRQAQHNALVTEMRIAAKGVVNLSKKIGSVSCTSVQQTPIFFSLASRDSRGAASPSVRSSTAWHGTRHSCSVHQQQRHQKSVPLFYKLRNSWLVSHEAQHKK